MTVLRLLPLPLHAALEFTVGFALMAAPFVLGFSPSGMVASLTAGALVIGLALSAAVRDFGRPGMAIAEHLALDRLFSLALVGGALALALAGDRTAAIALLAGSIADSAHVDHSL